MKYPEYIDYVLNSLEKNGFEAYIVGGAVRNAVLGIDIHDYDIATNALPNDVKHIFSQHKTIDTGIKHGTVTVIIDQMLVEITTYRIENEYTNHRYPTSVTFVKTLYEDLSRRDFTMNALAYRHQIIDYFGGLEDIKHHLIRCVNDPYLRFEEDALRILRALRFASRLRMEIEAHTQQAIIDKCHLLQFISMERIVYELNQIIIGSFAPIFDAYFIVFQTIIPEMVSHHQSYISQMLNRSDPNLVLRLAILLNQIPDYRAVLKRLKYANRIIEDVSQIIANINVDIQPNRIVIKKLLNQFGESTLRQIVLFRESLGEKIEIEEILNSVRNECYQLKDLKINGHDVMKLGLMSKEIAEVLNIVLDLVIEEQLPNERSQLLNYIKQMKKV